MNNSIILSSDKLLISDIQRAAEGLPVKFVAVCDRIKAALDVFREEPVKLVFADLFLPESSGIEILKTLKKVDENLIVILISRMRGRTVLERAFRHGASDVLIFPLQVDTIRQTILHRLEQIADEGMIHFQQS